MMNSNNSHVHSDSRTGSSVATTISGPSANRPSATQPKLPWELIGAILVTVVVDHYPSPRDDFFAPSLADARVENELRQYLYVARGLPRVHRAIVERFPGCAVQCAVADGRVDRLQVYAAVDPTMALNARQLGHAVHVAVRRGDTAVLQWLFGRPDAGKLRLMIENSTATGLIEAAARSDVPFCEWWLKSAAPYTRSEARGAMVKALDTAARLGHTRVLEWWVQNGFAVAKYTSRLVCTASAHGRIEALEWIVLAGLPIQQSTDAMDMASAHGHIGVLEWWCDALARGVIQKLPFQAPMTKATANGHVHVLDWWWTRFGCVPSPKDRDHGAVTAGRKGTLEVLDWWLADKNRWSSESLSVMSVGLKRALLDNHVTVLERWKRLVVESHAAANQAASFVPPLSWWADCEHGFSPTTGASVADFVSASRNGAIDAMRWWVAHKLPFMYSPKAIDCASQAGHVAVLDWWLHESGVEPLYTAAALANASRKGRVEVLEWWTRSGLPLKYTDDTRRDGIESGTDGIAIWWRSSEMPPSVSVEVECLPKIVKAFESDVGGEKSE
ncbi:hypothetical protein AMAG_09932 [Allomyces macrogynus ATCC 38327]|uniref:Uncharacterized protein n=1 Tax=Allomyces macrogynus (strain ATCC 38327) TaxID=578462 RepID=A0A0L0SPW3_ALLM3|nr:hypothetical protein AMAG_09932 [Allomyces macrogynus ATCC 38327]|eukprot:KNE64573.1 hypothetical protein AMAG_09932 [Allomyces macrogynus ATCC 38327]